MRDLIRNWLGLESVHMQKARRDRNWLHIMELSTEIGALKAVLVEMGATSEQLDAALKRHQEIVDEALAHGL